MCTGKQQQRAAGNSQLIPGYSSSLPQASFLKKLELGAGARRAPRIPPSQSPWVIYTHLKHVCLSEVSFTGTVIPLLTNEDVITVYSQGLKDLSLLKESRRSEDNWLQLTPETPTGTFARQKWSRLWADQHAFKTDLSLRQMLFAFHTASSASFHKQKPVLVGL